MGSKSPEHRAKMAAREARRQERSDRSLQNRANAIAARELAARIRHDLQMAGVDPNDIVKLDAEGAASKRAHVVGTPNPVTPSEEDGDHDDD